MRTIQVVAYTVLHTTSIPGMFLGVKILNQTSAALGCLEFYCSGSSSHNITTFQVFEEGLSPPTSIQVIQMKILHEFSETYEPYWTTGDFSADLQALTPVKFDLSISVMRNSRRTVIAMVLQPTSLAIESRALLEGNKSHLKRCNPTGKVVLQPSFFQLVFRGVNSVNIEHLSSESAREKTDAPVDKEATLGYISHRLDDLWRVQPSWKAKWNLNIF